MGSHRRMIFALLVAASWASTASAQRAVYLVRHAEKVQGDADSLTEHGREQARDLGLLLKDSGISIIYTSQYERTKQTAAGVADVLQGKGVGVRTGSLTLPEELSRLTQVLANDPGNRTVREEYERSLKEYAGAAVRTMREQSADGIVLVVGHDNTIPAIVEEFSHSRPAAIGNLEFTHLYLVVPAKGVSAAGVLHLPDYTKVLGDRQFDGTSEGGDFDEALRAAIARAKAAMATRAIHGRINGIASGPGGLLVSIVVKPGHLPGGRGEVPVDVAEADLYTGSSPRGDLVEAVGEGTENAIAALRAKGGFQADAVSWALKAFEVGPGGLKVSMEVKSGPIPPGGTNTLTAWSDVSLGDAARKAIEKATAAKNADTARFDVRSVQGRLGGFVKDRPGFAITLEPNAPEGRGRPSR